MKVNLHGLPQHQGAQRVSRGTIHLNPIDNPHMAITAYLYYEDADRALKFLAEAFGFRKYGVQAASI